MVSYNDKVHRKCALNPMYCFLHKVCPRLGLCAQLHSVSKVFK